MVTTGIGVELGEFPNGILNVRTSGDGEVVETSDEGHVLPLDVEQVLGLLRSGLGDLGQVEAGIHRCGDGGSVRHASSVQQIVERSELWGCCTHTGVRAERRSTVMRTLPLLPPGIYATGIQRERIKPNTELNRRFKTSKGEMKRTGG